MLFVLTYSYKGRDFIELMHQYLTLGMLHVARARARLQQPYQHMQSAPVSPGKTRKNNMTFLPFLNSLFFFLSILFFFLQ